MKKLMTLAALVTISFIATNVNAQPAWARANGHRDDRRDYREDRRDHDNRRYDRDDRRVVVYNAAPQRRYYAPQPQRQAYYYYPKANVYYNPYARNYYYPRNGVWVSVNTLPNEVYVNEPYQEVYCNEGENIWANNRCEVDYYRPQPRVVVVQPARPRVSVSFGVRF